MKRILLYHPFGNQNVRGVLSALSTHNKLHSFHTTIAVFPHTFLYKILPLVGLKKILRREYDKNIKNRTYCYPWKELLRLSKIPQKLHINITSGNINIQLNKKISNFIIAKNEEILGAYCYAHGALDIFKACQKYNKLCFYDLPIAYYKEIIEIAQLEKRQNPQWSDCIYVYKNQKNLHIIDEELKLADCIFVASSYVKSTLIKYGYNADNIYSIPYGFPPISPKEYRPITQKIKLLYVGGLHQLKGLSYMFEAIDHLKDKAELSIIGSGNLDVPLLHKYLKKYNYLGSLPHQKVLQEMRKCDILLFPTLSDGFGMVVTEAMSQGTPVITTNNCGAADLIKNDINGWIISSQSSLSIIDKLNYILNHPNEIERVGRNAIHTAQMRPWEKYNEDIMNTIQKICNKKNR